MSIDPKFVELTADVLKILLLKMPTATAVGAASLQSSYSIRGASRYSERFAMRYARPYLPPKAGGCLLQQRNSRVIYGLRSGSKMPNDRGHSGNDR